MSYVKGLSMNIREYLMKDICKQLDEAELEPYVIDQSWTNIYVIRFMHKLNEYAHMRINFQDGYWSCEGLPNQPESGPECGSYIKYAESQDFVYDLLPKLLLPVWREKAYRTSVDNLAKEGA